jgi:methylated-DNA-[protein]-cysteine S-methyltransferase
MTASATWYDDIESPVGTLRVVACASGLRAIEFRSSRTFGAVGHDSQRDAAPFRALRVQLKEYFAAMRREFDIDLAPLGTPFQQSVWNELRKIPYGTSTTYAELARRIRRPSAFRAVGAANGANPWPIVVPCHRVLGSDRSLTGFGGGLEAKQYLLRLEADALAGRRV